MRSLWQSGLQHVLAGETSGEELLRVTDVPQDRRGRSNSGPTAVEERSTAVRSPSDRASTASTADISFDLVDEMLDGAAAAGGARGATVLLVEDEESLRKVMRDLLERDGYTVAEAADGIQALDAVDRHAPDVILLDLNLPGLDGYSVLQQLRSRAATSGIPVIVLTAKGDEDNEVRVFQLGADDFLTKPFRARALSARLEAVLARRGKMR